ncbi:MAG: AAA family ATPase [Pseudomonadota bacterium]
MHDLELLINSGRRLIVLETEREGCFIDGFRRISKRSDKAYFQWTITQGLLRLAPDFDKQLVNKDINQLFAQIQSTERSSVYVLVDFHHHLQEPVAIRHIKDVLLHCPQHCIVLLSQAVVLPDDLKSLATHYDLPLPTTGELTRLVNDLAVEWLADKQVKLKVGEKGILKQLVKSLCGLSYMDAQRMARHAIYNDGIVDQNDIAEIATQKFELLNNNNVLSLELDYAELSDIAGFSKLKEWLQLRKKVFLGEVALPGEDKPKGMMLLGVQGCGKSLAAKAVAGSWNLPLLHLDFGTLYNRFYGQTEENLRTALSATEKMAPCVLWIDEIEKGLSAVSGTDDVSKRLLGKFLTWMAEKKSSVFIVATANDVSALPPELLRKGRFDEVFFVDLPRPSVRADILQMHLTRREQNPTNLDLAALVEKTEGFSGAELEQLVVSALYHTYDGSNVLDTDLMLKLVSETQPLSRLMHERVSGLRQWAQERAVTVD